MKNFRILVLTAMLAGILVLAGSKLISVYAADGEQLKNASTTQTQKKEPSLYTARSCFSRMTDMARRWSPDALPFHLESDLNSESTGQAGQVSVWRGLFASQSRRTFKTFICSGSRLPDAPPLGVTATAEMPYSANVPSLLFVPSYLQTDSDKAFTILQGHGGAELLKRDPKQPVLYLLAWDAKQKALLWYVTYGKSPTDRKGFAVLNASTGAFLRAGK
jgi:hypothetical protein